MRQRPLLGLLCSAVAIYALASPTGLGSRKAASARTAGLLSRAALYYANDWDGVTPWVKNQTILRMVIDPYAEGLEKPPPKDDAQAVTSLLHALADMPETVPSNPGPRPKLPRRLIESSNPRGGEFLFNLHLGGVNLDKLGANKKTAILFYDSKAWPDGSRTVAYADGHVAQVSRPKWRLVRKSLRTRYPREARKPLPGSPKGWGY
jgi:prepilin-type processing-associated H-X9-DG protein